MRESLCSIIVPIYNVEALLPRCIDSLIGQQYQNIEIILVNDGSTDSSEAICREYLNRDSRIKLINKENGGLSSARNAGLKLSKGEYIFFVDSDDYVTSDFCSVGVDGFLNHNADVVIFGFNNIFVDTNKIIKKHCKKSRVISKEEALKGTLIDGYINSLAWNKAYKRELFDNIKYPEGMVFEDVGTTYKIFDKANTIYITSNITYNYEIRNGSLSNKWWCNDKKINDFFALRYNQLQFINKNYPSLIKLSYATTGFVAIMAHVFFKEKNELIDNWLDSEKKMLIHSAFPYSILFRFFYFAPKLSKKIIKRIF